MHNRMSYKAYFKTILNKVLSRFHILDNLEVVVQFINDVIIVTFKANCSIEIEHFKSLLKRRSEVRRFAQ